MISYHTMFLQYHRTMLQAAGGGSGGGVSLAGGGGGGDVARSLAGQVKALRSRVGELLERARDAEVYFHKMQIASAVRLGISWKLMFAICVSYFQSRRHIHVRSYQFPSAFFSGCFLFLFFIFTFYFPACLVGGFTLSHLLDKPWSQVSSLPPPVPAFIFSSTSRNPRLVCAPLLFSLY